MDVRKVMTRKVRTLSPDDSLVDAISLFRKYKISGAPVVEDGKLVGIITEKDVLSAINIPELSRDILSPPPFDFIEAILNIRLEEMDIKKALGALKTGKVKDLMKTDVITVTPDTDVSDAVGIMFEHGINRLPVLDDGKLVGIVTRWDLLKALV